MSDDADGFSPFDRFDGSGIDGYVVDDRSDQPRVQGYALGPDLARHYDFSEVMYLSLCGEFPTSAQRRMFDVAMMGAMRVTVGDASVHGARIARHLAHLSRNPGSVVPAASVGVSEMTRTEIEEHRALLKWLEVRTGDPPGIALSETPDPFVVALRTALEDELSLTDFFDAQPTSLAAVIAMLWASGLSSFHGVAAAMTTARLPIAVAEAHAVPDPTMWAYPLNLPFWDYEHRRNEGDDD